MAVRNARRIKGVAYATPLPGGTVLAASLAWLEIGQRGYVVMYPLGNPIFTAYEVFWIYRSQRQAFSALSRVNLLGVQCQVCFWNFGTSAWNFIQRSDGIFPQ